MRSHKAAWIAGLGVVGWLALPGGAAALASLPASSAASNFARAGAPSAAGGQAAASPSTSAGGQETSAVRLAGYNAGFRDGVTAYRRQSPYDFQNQPAYQNGDEGYSAASGVDRATYVADFRAGYAAGFHDGFYGRSASASTAASAPAAAGQASPELENRANDASNPAAPGTAAAASDELPAGSTLQLKLNNAISAASSHSGDQFTAAVTTPVYNSQGQVLVPQGSTVIGKVESVRSAGGVSGESQIQLGFETLRLPDGSTHPLRAEVSQLNTHSGVGGVISGTPSTTNEGGVEQSRTRRTVGTAAAGGVAGALLGALAGGGKGAGIGGLVGAGLGVVLASRSGNLTLAAGTPITIRLDQPVALH